MNEVQCCYGGDAGDSIMPGAAAWLVFSCLSVVAAALNTVLNVEEINSIHYAVDILSKPVLKDQVRPRPGRATITR